MKDILFNAYIGMTIFCLVCAPIHFIHAFRKDWQRREEQYYSPDLTVGRCIGWLFMCVCPILSAGLTVYYAINVIERLCKYLDKFLNIPLVPKKARAESHKPSPKDLQVFALAQMEQSEL